MRVNKQFTKATGYRTARVTEIPKKYLYWGTIVEAHEVPYGEQAIPLVKVG